MVAVKTQQANSFLANPDKSVRAILIFGPDAGLVSERARNLAAKLAARENPPGEIVRVEDPDLENDPEKLEVELLTVPMFGGAKIVRTSAGRRVNVTTLEPLLSGPPFPGAIVVEAGNLRGEDKLRALFEKAPHAAAVACYADEGASLGELVAEVLQSAKLDITPDARTVLLARLGADRGLSRSEIEKLTIFAAGVGTIDVEHVEAIVGDASELAIDRVLAAAASGDVAGALVEYDRAVSSGESPQTVILLAQRHFQRLHRVRAAVEAGRSVDQAIGQIRPPVFFKQKAQLERQLRTWNLARLAQALGRIGETAKAARLSGALEVVLAETMLMDVARLARGGAGAGRPAA